MSPVRGTERRQSSLGRPGDLPDRRCGVDRRKLQLTEEAIALLEAHLVNLATLPPEEESANEGSGWDKTIVPVK